MGAPSWTLMKHEHERRKRQKAERKKPVVPNAVCARAVSGSRPLSHLRPRTWPVWAERYPEGCPMPRSYYVANPNVVPDGTHHLFGYQAAMQGAKDDDQRPIPDRRFAPRPGKKVRQRKKGGVWV